MDLLLWRHAHALDALPGQPDMDRALSRKGEKQAAAMAKWLNGLLPENTQIMCSPAKRTLQTVAFLQREFEVCEHIAPDSDAKTLIQIVDWPFKPHAVLVVAHQPFLAQTVAQILGLNPKFPLSFRKSGVWWIRHKDPSDSLGSELVCVQTPETII